jgi:hypothetical protein
MDPMPQVTREAVWESFSFFREFHFFPGGYPNQDSLFFILLDFGFCCRIKN